MIEQAKTKRMVTLTIDGRELRAPEGTYLLEIAREAGIEIPTLCDDPALEPTGACRLCQVEVTHEGWKGWTGLMTACLYPAAEGIEVRTTSPAVQDARRRVLSLLAARCPRSEVIQALARKYGASTERMHVDAEADNCILCGLCTRICETYVTSAITTYGRGTGKAIGTFAEAPPEDCVGCGACALVCPTGHIVDRRTDTGYEIWGRTFETEVCVVDPVKCLGCGACEEACPFDVARVVFSVQGGRVATIPTEHCRGCGACVGACPSGAIDQLESEAARLTERLRSAPITVMACPRNDLESRMPVGDAHLLTVPCTGRVSTSLLLDAIAHGSKGVAVFGRHQESCRLNGAEDPASERVDRVRRALAMVGYEPERVVFELPDPGPEGPLRAVTAFAERIESLGAPELPEAPPADLWQGEGLDTDLSILYWLSLQPGVVPDGSAWLREHGLPAAKPGGVMFYPGALPYVDVLADSLIDPVHVPDLCRAALRALDELGHEDAGVVVAGPGAPVPAQRTLFEGASLVVTLCPHSVAALEKLGIAAKTLDELLRERANELPIPPVPARVACDGTPGAIAMIEALGHVPVDVGPDPLPDRSTISPEEREEAERRLADAEAKGAVALLVGGPRPLVYQALITRRGTWRSSRVLPVLAAQLANLSFSGTRLSHRALEAAVTLDAEPAEVTA